MPQKQFVAHDANRHSGTENLYWSLTGEYPFQDVSKDDIPRLLFYLRRMNRTPRASEHLIRFYGIDCPRTSIEDLAKEHGFRDCDIQKSITITLRNIRSEWGETFFAMYGACDEVDKNNHAQGNRMISTSGPIRIVDLGFSVPVYNALTRIGIITLGDLLRNRTELPQKLSTSCYSDRQQEILYEVTAVLARLDLLI